MDKDREIAQLLPFEECTRPRTPQELRKWVLAKCNVWGQRRYLKEPVLLRRGRFKPFHEEIYPLSLFAVRRYGDRQDVLIVPTLDQGRDFDAHIREPLREFPIEITTACDPDQHLRMEYYVGHSCVPLTGPVVARGTKRKGRQIEVVLECVDHQVSRTEHLAFIKAAAEGKKGLGRYGKNYELLIAVEDQWFEPDDTLEIEGFVKSEVLTLPLEFRAIHLIGLTDRLYLSFDVPSPSGARTITVQPDIN